MTAVAMMIAMMIAFFFIVILVLAWPALFKKKEEQPFIRLGAGDTIRPIPGQPDWVNFPPPFDQRGRWILDLTQSTDGETTIKLAEPGEESEPFYIDLERNPLAPILERQNNNPPPKPLNGPLKITPSSALQRLDRNGRWRHITEPRQAAAI